MDSADVPRERVDVHLDQHGPQHRKCMSAARRTTIHLARPEIACVLHTHSIAGCAALMQRDGLLRLNQHGTLN
jgi:ribulose-5-phosphate 4-epimerase/fuculose-1-phosphate aldolase